MRPDEHLKMQLSSRSVARIALLAVCIMFAPSWPMVEGYDTQKPLVPDPPAVGKSTDKPTGIDIVSGRPLLLKVVLSSLAALAALIVGSTYWTLMRSSNTLLHGLSLPLRAMEANMTTILEQSWHESLYDKTKSGQSLTGGLWYLGTTFNSLPWLTDTVIGLGGCIEFIVQGRGKRNPQERGANDTREGNIVYGYKELCSNMAQDPSDDDSDDGSVSTEPELSQRKQPVLWFPTTSPVMRSVVQLVVWEWVTLWLVLIMIINTLIYNGFLGGGMATSDRFPRLFLISIYALLFLFHLWNTLYVFASTYTSVTLQASWGSVYRGSFFHRSDVKSSFFNVLGPGTSSLLTGLDIDPVVGAKSLETYVNPYEEGTVVVTKNGYKCPATRVYHRDKKGGLRDNPLFKKLIAKQDSEIKAFESASALALERIIFNMTLIFGLCLSTGFAAWIEQPLNDATSTQIGSYALLAFVSAAFGASFASLSHLGIIRRSAKELLRLTEHAIGAGYNTTMGYSVEVSEPPASGFTTKWLPKQPVALFKCLWEFVTYPTQHFYELDKCFDTLTQRYYTPNQSLYTPKPVLSRLFDHVLFKCIAGIVFGPGYTFLPRESNPPQYGVVRVNVHGHSVALDLQESQVNCEYCDMPLQSRNENNGRGRAREFLIKQDESWLRTPPQRETT